MKYADCNARQKKAYRNIYHASNWLLGGLENTMQDNAEGTEEHENAKATLADHDGLVAELYRMAFCGKEWLMARCEARIKKAGY